MKEDKPLIVEGGINWDKAIISSEDMITVPVGMNVHSLISIELDSITSVPVVYYQGKRIDKKVRVYFDWQTADENIKYDSPVIRLEFLPDNPTGDMKTEVIEHRGKANAVKE